MVSLIYHSILYSQQYNSAYNMRLFRPTRTIIVYVVKFWLSYFSFSFATVVW